MYSKKGYQTKNNSNPIPKKQKPRPQWTTDFTDYDRFKLSEAQMIQKKAALQSKHRQQAKTLLQQRRRKLEMGIIDEQTKKVFQTALLSKNIDINPPIRKNLTQMIQYEREQQSMNRTNQQQDDEEQQQYEQNQQQKVQKDLKQAQAFIKKFQKAKKQPKIERAMQIILQEGNKINNQQSKKTKKQQKVSPMTNNFLSNKQAQNYQKKSVRSNKTKQNNTTKNQDALSSIEDTIKFMQEKLFAAKKSVNDSFISKQHEDSYSFDKFQGNNQFKLYQDTQNKFNCQQKQEQFFSQNFGQLSHLKINLQNQENSDEDECMETIRRMRQMIDSKQDLYQGPGFKKQKQNRRDDNFETTDKRMNISPSLGFTSTIQKNSHNYLQSEAEVDFSLTQNNDSMIEIQNKNKKQYFAPTSNIDLEYQKLKQNLFLEMEANSHQYGNNYNIDNEESFQKQPRFVQDQFKKKYFDTQLLKQSQINDQDNQSVSITSKMSKKHKKSKTNKISQQVQAMKNMIQNMKTNIQSTKIQPLKIDHKDPVVGFDFRGSINIKKNIITK